MERPGRGDNHRENMQPRCCQGFDTAEYLCCNGFLLVGVHFPAGTGPSLLQHLEILGGEARGKHQSATWLRVGPGGFASCSVSRVITVKSLHFYMGRANVEEQSRSITADKTNVKKENFKDKMAHAVEESRGDFFRK